MNKPVRMNNKTNSFTASARPFVSRVAVRSVLCLCMSALAACGGGATPDIPAQRWRDVEVRVESRPSPPTAGMNEFLVIITGEHDRPVYDVMVSLRTAEQDEWVQAIQDGQVGVYRRAARVARGERSVLQVQIKRKDSESVLRFPLQLAP